MGKMKKNGGIVKRKKMHDKMLGKIIENLCQKVRIRGRSCIIKKLAAKNMVKSIEWLILKEKENINCYVNGNKIGNGGKELNKELLIDLMKLKIRDGKIWGKTDSKNG